MSSQSIMVLDPAHATHDHSILISGDWLSYHKYNFSKLIVVLNPYNTPYQLEQIISWQYYMDILLRSSRSLESNTIPLGYIAEKIELDVMKIIESNVIRREGESVKPPKGLLENIDAIMRGFSTRHNPTQHHVALGVIGDLILYEK